MIQPVPPHPALIQRHAPLFNEGVRATAFNVGVVAIATLGSFLSFVFLPWQTALATSGVLTALLAMLFCPKTQDPPVIVAAQSNQDQWYHRIGRAIPTFFREVGIQPVAQAGPRVPVGGIAPVAAVPVRPPVIRAPIPAFHLAAAAPQPPQGAARHLVPEAHVPVGHAHRHRVRAFAPEGLEPHPPAVRHVIPEVHIPIDPQHEALEFAPVIRMPEPPGGLAIGPRVPVGRRA